MLKSIQINDLNQIHPALMSSEIIEYLVSQIVKVYLTKLIK